MTEFIFSSTNPHEYHTIICPLNTTFKECSWYIKQLTGIANIKILDKNDFITINDYTIRVNKTWFKIDNKFFEWFQSELSKISVKYDIDDGFRFSFNSKFGIKITDCSYYFRQLLGLYNSNLPLYGNELCIESSGIINGSSLWYILSNNGSSCVINHSNRDYYCFVSMRVYNDFKPCRQFCVNNNDFKSTSLGLSWLSLKIVDENFEPIRFTSPIHVYLSITPTNTTDQIVYPTIHRPMNCPKTSIIESLRKIENFNEPKFNKPTIIETTVMTVENEKSNENEKPNETSIETSIDTSLTINEPSTTNEPFIIENEPTATVEQVERLSDLKKIS
jgi:hypothetical protein